jgi:hypothetical protein
MDYSQEPERQTDDEAREQRVKQLILAAVTRCSECRRRYHLEDVSIIGHRDHLWMVTVVCEACRTQGFITAVLEDSGQAVAGALPSGRVRRRLTELSAEEAARFAAAPPVSSIDVLDLHEFLDDFDGDFAGLFGRPGTERRTDG